MTPSFLSMADYLSRFSTFSEKMKNLSSRSLNILENTHLTSSFSCASVSNASLRVKVCGNDGNI